jgi:hypothetical protein
MDYSFGTRPDENHFFMTTDRIVLNARSENIYISAKANTHIGAGADFIVDTSGDTIIESDNIYLGKHARMKRLGSADPYTEPMHQYSSAAGQVDEVWSEDVNYEKLIPKFDQSLDGCTEEEYDNLEGPCYEQVIPPDFMRGPAEPLVLGEQLRIVLMEMLDVMESLKVTNTILGTSGPVDKVTYDGITALKNKIKNVTTSPFNSDYHFIESNKYSVSPGHGGNPKQGRTDDPNTVNVPDDIGTVSDQYEDNFEDQLEEA